MYENAGLNRYGGPAFTSAEFAGLAGLYALPSRDSLASGDKGHECRMSGPRFRPLDIFGHTLLRCSFRPKLVERDVAPIFKTTQD
jgi:hypothetical protein